MCVQADANSAAFYCYFALEDAMRFRYPLRAMRISFELMPFGIWLKPQFVYRRHLAEQALESGERLWWFRWLWVQVSYSRWT
jgi:hypothetical protein